MIYDEDNFSVVNFRFPMRYAAGSKSRLSNEELF